MSNKKYIKFAFISLIIASIFSLAIGTFAFMEEGKNIWILLLSLLCCAVFGIMAGFVGKMKAEFEEKEKQSTLTKEMLDSLFALSNRQSAEEIRLEALKQKSEEKRKEEERLAELREEQDIRDFRQKIVDKYKNSLNDEEGSIPPLSSNIPIKPLFEVGNYICPVCGAKQVGRRDRCWKCNVPFEYY